ncbi:peptide/nickel transport system ATP-binding protein/peptide/nickel transport system ATP-binding protein [Halomicrobium zhouii]|uniref:Nickel import system ATP-binding protein NikD n=1 Tax=Halomicrobium zhouii TaxID=767519 RepID=A0A1I6L8B0_9EURY|nr:ABC transporter ATP-binding protein [Halomicrobium zhouii]SFR99743.1 peptide/nickel transport system ATP-binding protein/peptide/nickel transport system ATP-binding protein [Halomicrobium zhouii]
MAIDQSGTTGTPDADEDEPEDIVMSVRDARVSFDMARGQAWVLNDVDLDVRRNEILAVVGESGSGKSMFASALLDAVEDPGRLAGDVTYYPDEAAGESQTIGSFDEGLDDSVDVLDLDPDELQAFRWEKVSMVFQGAMNSFNPTMKIKAHFHETIQAHNAVLEERMDHVRKLFDALYIDFDRVMTSYPHELSGGIKQRTLIALALVLEPEVLVMDEPTAALDLLMQRSIISMLRNLRDEFDLTIVFITHDLPLVGGLADRIAVMYAFEFVEVGATRDLMKNAAHPYTRSLLRSVPSITSDVDEMEPIEGARPDPVNIPTGCSFHPRCPVADDRCEIEDPDLAAVEDDLQAACFYTDQAREQIDYTLEDESTGDDR